MNRQRDVEQRSRPRVGDDASSEGLLARTPDTEPRGGHPMSATTRAPPSLEPTSARSSACVEGRVHRCANRAGLGPIPNLMVDCVHVRDG